METNSRDDVQTIGLLQSAGFLMDWLSERPAADQDRLFAALAERSEKRRAAIAHGLRVAQDPQATPEQRAAALQAGAEALSLVKGDESSFTPSAVPGTLEANFAARLRQLMEEKRITQQELANRVGCSQPAISQLLSRQRRPRKETLLALAAALSVAPEELWPKLHVLEMFDAIAELQEDGYVMSEAEAQAFREPKQPRPKIPIRRLPTVRRDRASE
ncbi:MAG TPA: helix-turn-helix transcriptional regulator [Pirellulales bacterium]